MSFKFWRLKQDSTLGLRASVIHYRSHLPVTPTCQSSEERSECRSETLSRYFAWSARIARVSSCSSHPFIVHRTRGTMNQPLDTSVELR